MNPLVVAHVVATTGRTGVEAHLRVLFEALRDLGVRPILVCPQPGPLTETLEQRGFEVRLAAPRRRAGVFELPATAAAVRDATLIHGHGPRAQWWTGVLRRTGAAPVAVATLHEIGRSGAGSRGPRRLFDPIESWTVRAHDRVIAVSGWIKRRACEATGIPADRVDVVLNSCPLMLDPPRALDPPSEPAYALAAARLQREKGLDVLLRAVALLSREGTAVRVRVLGEGVERPNLEALSAELGVTERVELAGWASDVPDQMRRATVYLNPSRDEPCSVAVLEAMSLGVPIVGTTVGGNVELLEGVDEPRLVPHDDPRALADAIREVLAMSAEERLRIRRRLQERAYAEFSPQAMALATCRTYERALEQRGIAWSQGGGAQSDRV